MVVVCSSGHCFEGLMNEEFTNQDDNLLTVDQAIANLQGEDLGLRMYAAWWLGRFRVDDPTAIDVLMAALHDEDDRTQIGGYPLRRAVPVLIEALACSDFYVREAAAQALETLGDLAGVPTLLKLLHNQIPGTLPAPEPPCLIQPYDAILEALGGLGDVQVIDDVRPFLDHEIPRIQYAAARAMYQLSDEPAANQYGDRLIQALLGSELQLRRTALADLGAIGYLAAAQPIAETLAENSLKLISLKGLLEKQLQLEPLPSLSKGAIEVMALMDQLL
jgi:phycocyanobilin lyase subunit alpha